MHLVMLHISRLSSLHNIKCSLKCALHYITKDGQNCKNTVIRRAILPKCRPVFRRATWAHWFCNHHENWTGKSPQGPDSSVDGDLFIPPRQRKNPVSDEWEGSPRSTWAPALTKGVSEEEWLPHQTLIPPHHKFVELSVLAKEGEPIWDNYGGTRTVQVCGGEGATGGVLGEDLVCQEVVNFESADLSA